MLPHLVKLLDPVPTCSLNGYTLIHQCLFQYGAPRTGQFKTQWDYYLSWFDIVFFHETVTTLGLVRPKPFSHKMLPSQYHCFLYNWFFFFLNQNVGLHFIPVKFHLVDFGSWFQSVKMILNLATIIHSINYLSQLDHASYWFLKCSIGQWGLSLLISIF